MLTVSVNVLNMMYGAEGLTGVLGVLGWIYGVAVLLLPIIYGVVGVLAAIWLWRHVARPKN